MIKFTVFGSPQAQKRHRHYSRGKFVRVYDPDAKDKEAFLAEAMAHRPEAPLDQPLHVVLGFHFEHPKSHFGAGRNKDRLKPSSPVMHTNKPDCDNLAKFVLDALNGIFWKDDSVICSLTIDKHYSETAHTRVTIQKLRLMSDAKVLK